MANNIFILNGQDRSPITHINKKHVLNNNHSQSLETGEHTFTMTVMGDFPFAEHLSRRNILVIPGEDGEFLEFRIIEGVKYRDDSSVFVDVWSTATFLDLKKKKVFDPVRTEPFTAEQHAMAALANTGWQVGNVDFSGSRTLTFEKPFNSYDYLKRISSEFKLEMRFYVTTDEGGITGHYVDLVNRIGEFRGRIARFGKDLTSIRRIENTENIVTALWAYGPEREDNTRLKTLIADEDALQRWGERGKNGELTHIIDIYEPQSNDQDMTLDELKRYGRTELNKRINAAISFEANIVDLEHVPGLENKIIRFGDTIMTKDESFQPPLYVEARIYKQDRDVFVKDSKKVELGDFTEYTEEEVNAIWQSLQNEIRNRLSKLLVTTVVSSAGNTFKNGVGSTELSATVFLTGNETDKDGTIYDYKWSKRDKGGALTSFEANGKTITVNAEDIDQKATYIVDVIQEGHTLSLGVITISNVYDGEQGIPGKPGEDGRTPYLHIAYADDAQGNGFSQSPDDKDFIGTYTDFNPTDSNNPSDYKWQKARGPNKVDANTNFEAGYNPLEKETPDGAQEKANQAKEGAKNDVQTGEVGLPGDAVTGTISGDHLDIDLSVFGATPQYMSIYAYNLGVWTIQSIAAGSTPSNWHTFDFFKFRPTKQYLTVDGRGKIVTTTGSGRVYGWLVVELYNSTGLSSDTRLSLNTLTTASRDFMITVDISGHDNAYLRFKFDKTGGEEDGYGGIRVRQIYMHN